MVDLHARARGYVARLPQRPGAGPLGGTVARYTDEGQRVRDGWRATSRPLACARYLDGALQWCRDQGGTFWELEYVNAAALRATVPPLPERQRDTGMHRLNLQTEYRRTGVPEWFKPNASRRRRTHAWTNEGPARWVLWRGHHVKLLWAGQARHHRLDVRVYLRDGQPVGPCVDDVLQLLAGYDD